MTQQELIAFAIGVGGAACILAALWLLGLPWLLLGVGFALANLALGLVE